jgi:hypothetical protein
VRPFGLFFELSIPAPDLPISRWRFLLRLDLLDKLSHAANQTDRIALASFSITNAMLPTVQTQRVTTPARL